MTEPNESRREIPSLKLTEDQSDGQGQIRWNGNYGKYWAQHFRTQAMAHSKSTTLDPTLLAKAGELLLKCMETIGTETKPCTRRCDELVRLSGVDGDVS